MGINWKLRVQNRVTLTAIITDIVAVIFSIMNLVQTKNFSQQSIMDIVKLVIEVFVLLGIVIDPTTEGLSDSEKALTYTTPQ